MEAGKEDLAIALWVEKTHGRDGAVYIAEQIGRLALNDDFAGVERWKKIAKQYDALSRGSVQ